MSIVKVALIAGSAAALFAAGAGVASAEPVSAQSTRVDVCFAGACGSATFVRTGPASFRPVNMSVKDNKCDGNSVFVQAIVTDGRPEPSYLTRHYNHLGCHGGYVSWSSYLEWPAPITGLSFRICVDDYGSPTCKIAL